MLAGGTLLLFARVAGFDFLHYDDNVYVTENPQVLRGLSWDGVVWAFSSWDAWYGYPLDWLSHMLDVQVFGVSAGAHHLVSAVVHAANVALVYGVLSSLTGRAGRSAVVAALFAVHPLRVEPVAWISERKELLASFFGLLAILAYVAYAKRPTLRGYALVALAFAASLLSKPMWVTLPCLLLLLDAWPLRRTDGVRPLVLEKAPLAGLAIAASVVAVLAQRHGGTLRDTVELGLASRVGYAAVSYVLYVAKTAWPSSLSPYYPHPGSSLPSWQVVGAVALLAITTGLALRQRARRPWLPVGWLWFVGMLVPVLGLVQAGGHGIADRYTYAPSIGLLVVVVWGLSEVAERLDAVRLARGALAAVVIVLAVLTWRQAAYWSDHITLFTRAVAVTEDDWTAHLVLSQGLAAAGRYPEALVHAREAARRAPGVARVRKNLGYVLYRLGLVDDAIDELRAAVEIAPDYAEAHGNLGFAYGKKGWAQEAMKELAIERQLSARGRAQ